ncbi:hypothetical protein IEQ34_022393 [Dendrobium chrysotoxum]|uniref:Uncharacterized protein n=1 Tax=Dendrobium chrysotoxum TaxID=161865 RepID=A0AAV7FYX8_DENCH|nr:hypothetical protein IEQ34_022393 [Dendrobium chrysotoxum]
MVPVKRFDGKLSLRRKRRSARRSEMGPERRSRGSRTSTTRPPSTGEHVIPRQAHGAESAEGSQPESTPSGS